MVEQLKFVQFPWRFLTLVILGFSLAIGSLSQLLPQKGKGILIGLLIIAVVIFNMEFFVPEHGKLGPLTDVQKFSNAAWDLQRTAGIYDYLPKTAKRNPRDGQNTVAELVGGEAEITNKKQGTNWASFDIDVKTPSATIRINIYQFPDWKVFINAKEVTEYVPEEEEWGRMYVDIPEGNHEVYAKLYDTPVRLLGNIISLITWVFLGLFCLKNRNKIAKQA
jgi:hypothetical protein